MKHEGIKRTSKRNYLSPIIIVLIAGALLTWWTSHRTYLEMRNDMLQHVRIVAQCINLQRLVSLSGTESDLDNPDYIRLKNQLMNARSINPKCRFIYLMGRKTNGKVFFFVDSEPTGSKNESPPGQIYEEVSDEYLLSFNTKKEMTVGPITDRWGEWVTFLIPITDLETGHLITVMGMDIDISDWYISIAKNCIFPVGLSLCILLLCIFVIKLQQINKRFENHEEKYRESEKRYQNLFENALVGLFRSRLSDGLFLEINSKGAELLLHTREEIIGKIRTTDLFRNLDQRTKLLSELKEKGEVNGFETDFTLDDGAEKTFSISVKSYPKEGFMEGAVIDITTQKEIEKALRESEQYYRMLADNVSDVIWKADMNLRYNYLSPSIEGLLGFTSEEHIPKTLEQMIPPASLKLAMEVFDEELKIETTLNKDLHRTRTLEIEQFCKDGSTIWTEVKMTFLRDENDKAVEILGMTRDITERKKAEEEHAIHLAFLQNMELINRIIHETNSLDQMMSNVLESTLEIFDCDRAWLLYPCDPDAKSWRVPMEKTKPEFPGAFELNKDIPRHGNRMKISGFISYNFKKIIFIPSSAQTLCPYSTF